MMKRLFFFFILLISLVPVIVNAQQLTSYVTDNAAVFSAESKQLLENSLRAIETETNGVQFVVFTEKTIPEGTTLEERTLKLAEENKVGKKGNDNGILLYLATEDRQYRWEVGYGIEATLSAPRLRRISDDYMVPEFKQGNYALGLIAGVLEADKILHNSTDSDIL
jgi:uncharacterized protein